MDAAPMLGLVAGAMRDEGLEGVLIGNAGAVPTRVAVGGVPVLVASLSDIIRSKRAAKRPQELAVLPLLEQAREEAEAAKGRARRPPKRG